MAFHSRDALMIGKRVPWGPGSKVAITTTSSTAITWTAHVALEMRFVPTSAATSGGTLNTCHVRWGDSSVGAATTSDMPLVEFEARRFVPQGSLTHFRAIGSAPGTLYYVSIAT